VLEVPNPAISSCPLKCQAALKKNGGGRIQCQADRIPVEFRGLRQEGFGWLSYVAKDTFLTLA